MVRGGFISGLSSHNVRQHLLENNASSLDRAFDIASSLNMGIEQRWPISGAPTTCGSPQRQLRAEAFRKNLKI